MRVINQDKEETMRSDVRKTHHHSHRHRHNHSKHRRRHKETEGKCSDDVSPVISVPSDTTASETYFPIAKERDDNSGSESPENSAPRKRHHRYSDTDSFQERTGLNSESEDNGRQEHTKHRRKHKHKEKKKRKHSRKDEGNTDIDKNNRIYLRDRGGREAQSGDNSQIQHREEHKAVVRVKQEPLSSDEETRQRHRSDERRRKNSVSDTLETSRNLRPHHTIKVEQHDRSSSHERDSRSDGRHGSSGKGNGNSYSNYEHRDRRNGRVNGERSSVKEERAHSSRAIERSRVRRQRSNEREDHSRERENESKPVIRRIKKQRSSDDEREYEWGKPGNRQAQAATNSGSGANAAPADKKKPNFGLSGKLTEDVNVYNGVVIKYSEPPEARKPKRRWRFYPFKGDETLPTLYIHRQSAYLIGRDRKVADIPVDHPSCSKQHAALQYRLVPFTREDGTKGKRVRPYIIDLESSNGTYVNNKRIEPRKYVELMERDVIKFGYSSRDYVLLHEHSKGDEEDDDQNG